VKKLGVSMRIDSSSTLVEQSGNFPNLGKGDLKWKKKN